MSGVVNCGMQQFRLALAALCAMSVLVLGATRSSATQSSIAAPESCAAQLLTDGVNAAGSARVVAVTRFACEGSWAYLWADVNVGTETIGVTMVLKWRPDLNSWWPTDRAVTCVEGLLPETIYRPGCFSN
ncbi:MAG: hypothetical protein WCG62_03405 [Actinomycetes bacterium]